MNIKEDIYNAKESIVKRWKVIVTLSGVLITIAILVGLFWTKERNYIKIEKVAKRKNINRIYFQYIKDFAIKDPPIGYSVIEGKKEVYNVKGLKDKTKRTNLDTTDKQINPKEYVQKRDK